MSRTRPVLLHRARPFQVLLAVGAVLLVSAGVAVASAYGGAPLRWLLLVVAAAAAVCSVLAAWAGLRSSEEILAVSAAGLVIAGSDLGGPVLEGDPGTPAVLAVVFLALHHRRLAPTTAVWSLASWAALQLAVLRALDSVPGPLRTATFLAVALVGLGIALFGRPLVARVALLTAAPWWLVGVFRGSTSAWTASGAERWLAAGLMIVAASGLLVARLRKELDPLLGPPRAVPVVAGLVAGAATAGAFSSLGALATTLTGYAGVLLATLSAAYLTGWRRGLLLPVALTAGIVMTLLCVVQLVAAERWSQLCLLLLLTALPTVVVAVRHPEDQPVAVPTALGCLAGAILLALPDGLLTPVAAALWLTALYGAAMAVGSRLDPPSRLATARAAAVCAVAAAALLRAQGEQGPLAAVLLALGAFTLVWAWRTRRRPRAAGLPSVAWRVGAGQLVLGLWVAGAAVDITQVEWYSLTAAVGLLIAAGPKLLRGASGPAWGPGLLTAAVPSALLAVVRPDAGRAVGVVVVAALAMVIASRTGVRAPLVIGAATELWIAFGFTVRALPWPLATALVVGALLAAQGMRRERRPVPFHGTRLAALR